MSQLTATFLPNGPIKFSVEENASKDILFLDQENKKIELKKSFMICRCGQSSKQPYCDGSHKKVNFTDKIEQTEDLIQEYEGLEASITFNRSICSGAARCVEEFSNIYDSSSSTNWIFPNKGSLEQIKQSVINCPSGALSYTINESRVIESYDKIQLQIIKQGPLNILGEVELKDITFSSFANPNKFSLCRCGASKNKPFCDYSHASLDPNQTTF